MSQREFIELLVNNGYAIDPIFGYYCIPKKPLGYFFLIKENDVIIVGKISWNTIKLQEIKSLRVKNIQPHNYGLVTPLDIKQTIVTRQRIAANRNKFNKAKKDGYKEPSITIPDNPTPDTD